VIFVGDRGMIKSKGKEALGTLGWRYISALTKQQIRALLKRGVLQPDLFDQDIGEVAREDKRLILRRNESVQRRERARRSGRWAQAARAMGQATQAARLRDLVARAAPDPLRD
jgi:cytochrome c-type biogenesis protein CcmH/NrfG